MKKQPKNKLSEINRILELKIKNYANIYKSFKNWSWKHYSGILNKNSVLTRLLRADKPHAYLLLILPIWWAVAMSGLGIISSTYYCIFFAAGGVLMRSAGCIINDIIDRDIDKEVARTQKRPLASGETTTKYALKVLTILLSVALLLLLALPIQAIKLGLLAILMTCIYPFTKRFTYLAQFFLGLTFNIGILMAWVSIRGNMEWIGILLYFAAALWTVGYDTIYAYQDIDDDKKLGLKSTAIKFNNNINKFLALIYQTVIALIAIAGLHAHLNICFFIGMAVAGYHLYLQLEDLDISNTQNCLNKFKSSIEFAFIILAAMILGRI